MAAKRQRAKRRISLSSKEEENCESDTGDKTNPDQADHDKNLLQLQKWGLEEAISNNLTKCYYIYTRI